MQNVTKEDIDVLVKFQDLEIQAGRIRASLENEIARINDLDSELKALEEKTGETETDLKALKKEYRDWESETQLNLSKIKKSEEKLWSIKNNKEYQSALKEIEELKKKNSQIEDRMLEQLDRIEDKEQQLVKEKNELIQVADQISQEKEEIIKENAEGKERLSDLENEADALSSTIRSDLMKLYRSLDLRVKGSSVVPVRDAVCKGCHMNIPAQLYNDLHHCNGLKFCPFCERIIYWRKPEEPQLDGVS